MRIGHWVVSVVVATVALNGLFAAASQQPASATTRAGCADNGVNPSKATIAAMIDAVATARNVPPQLLKVIAYKESGWRQFGSDGRTLYNPEDGTGLGGIGLMQLTGETARQFNVCRLFTDARYNIDSGAIVLSQKMTKALEGIPSPTPDRSLIENWYLAARYFNGGGTAANTYVRDVVTKLRTPPAAISAYTRPIAITAPRDVWRSYAEPTRIRATADKSWTFYSSSLTKTVVARGTGAVHAWRLGPYNIRNAAGFCVDIPNFGKGTAGGPLNQYPCNYTSSDNQRFWFTPVGTYTGTQGTYNVYEVKNVKDNLCMDVPGTGDNNAAALVSEGICRGPVDNQYWYKVPRPSGGSWLVNLKSKLCLDVAGVEAAGNDARLTLYHCSEADDHRWTLVR
jgi:hypothetical protein